MTNIPWAPIDQPATLDRHEAAADQLMRKHLLFFMGVISHHVWAGLRADIAQLMRRKKKRRKLK